MVDKAWSRLSIYQVQPHRRQSSSLSHQDFKGKEEPTRQIKTRKGMSTNQQAAEFPQTKQEGEKPGRLVGSRQLGSSPTEGFLLLPPGGSSIQPGRDPHIPVLASC